MTQTSEPYRGIFPIAPVAFHDNGELDPEGNARVLECMIDQGVDGICILANYSEQFLLCQPGPNVHLDTVFCLHHPDADFPQVVTYQYLHPCSPRY